VKKILINQRNFDVVLEDIGLTIYVGIPYTIVPNETQLWFGSVDVINHITLEDLVVSDGDNILPMRVGIALIQDNQIVINEFYTLVQDDDVLIGDGQILYLNDRFDMTENVPVFTDDFVEEDMPTDGY
jgi:hypothetical protein